MSDEVPGVFDTYDDAVAPATSLPAEQSILQCFVCRSADVIFILRSPARRGQPRRSCRMLCERCACALCARSTGDLAALFRRAHDGRVDMSLISNLLDAGNELFRAPIYRRP